MSEQVSIKCAVAGMTLRHTEVAAGILCRQVLQKLICQAETFNKPHDSLSEVVAVSSAGARKIVLGAKL